MTAPSRRQRGTSAGLTHEAIVAAAERVIDRSGFEGASLRSVAVELGVTPGALYNHFANKQELLDAVADEFLAREVLRRLPRALAPVERLRLVCRRLHAAGVAHPQLLLSVLGHIPERVDSAQLQVADVMLTALREAGATEQQQPVLYRALITLSAGNAVYDNHLAAVPGPEAKRRLAHQVEASRYPAFVSYLQSWQTVKAPDWFEAQLDLVLASLRETR